MNHLIFYSLWIISAVLLYFAWKMFKIGINTLSKVDISKFARVASIILLTSHVIISVGNMAYYTYSFSFFGKYYVGFKQKQGPNPYEENIQTQINYYDYPEIGTEFTDSTIIYDIKTTIYSPKVKSTINGESKFAISGTRETDEAYILVSDKKPVPIGTTIEFKDFHNNVYQGKNQTTFSYDKSDDLEVINPGESKVIISKYEPLNIEEPIIIEYFGNSNVKSENHGTYLTDTYFTQTISIEEKNGVLVPVIEENSTFTVIESKRISKNLKKELIPEGYKIKEMKTQYLGGDIKYNFLQGKSILVIYFEFTNLTDVGYSFNRAFDFKLYCGNKELEKYNLSGYDKQKHNEKTKVAIEYEIGNTMFEDEIILVR